MNLKELFNQKFSEQDNYQQILNQVGSPKYSSVVSLKRYLIPISVLTIVIISFILPNSSTNIHDNVQPRVTNRDIESIEELEGNCLWKQDIPFYERKQQNSFLEAMKQ